MAKREYSPAQAKAVEKYLTVKVDSITVRVPKGKKKDIQAAADASGVSLNQFCASAILEKVESQKKQ